MFVYLAQHQKSKLIECNDSLHYSTFIIRNLKNKYKNECRMLMGKEN